MTKTFEQAREEIARLGEYFATNRDAFLAPGVKEAHIRQSLIDPLFEALGWDVRNAAMAAPQYREVIPEASLDVEGQQKAPDYSFRVGTMDRFYVEAKKCGVNLDTDPAPAYQLRSYGWTAKISFSILTNFENLAVYDCTLTPRAGDKASRGRILYLGYEEYADRWHEVWDIFSRQAVWSGAFDQFAASKRKRGTAQVDDEFLKEIEGWREMLAHNIALRNQDIPAEDLNAAVQRTIDRIVFLRMAEDRGLEPFGQLLKLCERPDIYRRFMKELCRKADDKYNSGIFHFHAEDGIVEAPDQLTPKLLVDDRVLKPILQRLYFEHGSPYNFRVMPVEMLGTIYERFLGKVVRLTAGHQAKVEEKPEVRKAGGVYYTPDYIVNYIVRTTVGKKIAGKSPAELAGTKGQPPLRVMDMACGSGSFLLGAYQLLLDHCLTWYLEHKPEKQRPAVYYDPGNQQWRLTIAEKKRILTTHLFGVDIDLQAVEVTKLSLLLKALEGEDDASVSRQQELFHERALPNLANNIKCGNSLIGTDYFTGKLIADPDEMRRVNAFDWKQGFPEAMKAGGFDCVIGNPPYIRIQTMKEWAPLEVEIYKELFRSGRSGNYDIYVIFIEQALKLLRQDGHLGYICPNKFFNAKYGQEIRSIISAGSHLSQVVHFGDQQIFSGATTYTCLLFLNQSPQKEFEFGKVKDLEKFKSGPGMYLDRISRKEVNAAEWNFVLNGNAALFDKLSRTPDRLEDVTLRIFQGLKTSADKIYIVDELKREKRRIQIFSPQTEKKYWVEPDLFHPLVKGGDSHRYCLSPVKRLILFPYAQKTPSGKSALIDAKKLAADYPLTWAYLSENRDYLQKRERGILRGSGWYGFGRNQALDVMPLPKIFTPDLAPQAAYSYDATGESFFTGGVAGGYGILVSSKVSVYYLLGLLNSRLLDWRHHQKTTQMRGGWYSYESRFIKDLPVKLLDLSSRGEKATHDRLVKLVEAMQALHKQFASAKSEAQKDVIQRQIDATDREIDHLVYQLYGLSKEEIAIVENG